MPQRIPTAALTASSRPLALREIPDPVVERLSSYRRHLREWSTDGHDRIYSHQLATLEGITPAQVRRDLMTIGYTGSPARGYDVPGLVELIDTLLDPAGRGAVVVVGVGHIGGAMLDYFSRQHPEHRIVAAFDNSPERAGRVLHGHRCHHVDQLETVLENDPATVGIIAVPGEAAQEVAERLVRAGVVGLLNFAPVRVHVPPHVYVENVDISLSLEKVAFLARRRQERQEAQ